MNTSNIATIASAQNNSFGMYDKAMDLVTDVLGEELQDIYQISVVNNVCKVIMPLHVPLHMLSGRDDITVSFINNTSEILVH